LWQRQLSAAFDIALNLRDGCIAGEMAHNKLAGMPGEASRAAPGGPADWRTGLRTASKATKRAWF
jgi:hypothetical protein